MNEAAPRVTVVVPMRDEERAIARCLDSLLANDYPRAALEILVVDGDSRDRSATVVRSYAERDGRIRLLPNPRRSQAAAMNIGIANASGEIVVRADAHTTYAPDYVSRCVTVLGSTGAACVGGPQRCVGEGPVGRAIAAAMNSRFGAGDATYRRTDRGGSVDTVYLGAWRRDVLERAGGFDEQAPPNEDYELATRLRAAGGRIVLSPEIRSEYTVRASFPALAAQYFRYGRSKIRTLAKHPRSLRARQLAAPGLVVGLTVWIALRDRAPRLARAIPASYLAAMAAASATTARTAGWETAPLLPVAFTTMHVSWGVGFLAGIAAILARPEPGWTSNTSSRR